MAKHLLPASGIRHGNAARTGWDASPYRWTPFDRCFALALLRSANPYACRFLGYFCRCRPPPAPSIAAQHLRASWRNSVAARPVLDLDIQTFGAGCFGAGVCPKNGSAKPSASRSLARVSKPVFRISLCERPKQNAPGMESEGVRVPRRSGRPISWRRISRVCGNLSRRAVVRRRTAARTMPHRAVGARVRTDWGCGWRVSWLKSLDSSGETDAEDCDGRARYTRRFANANIFFTNASAADERL